MATSGQDDAADAEFKEVSLIFQARKAQPLSKTLIPELQKVIPRRQWQDFAQASADAVKSKYYWMWLLEYFGLTGSLVQDMKALCQETNPKIAQETNQFVGPNVIVEFRVRPGSRGPVSTHHGGGYQSTGDQDWCCSKQADEFTLVVTYRRAAFFKS